MTISRRCAAFSAVTLLAFAPAIATSAFAAPQPLTSCGQDLEGDSYYLTGDLDCTGVDRVGVNLFKRATLELRGFAIRNSEDFAVQCFRSCTIVGPGTISDNLGGVWAPRQLTITDVALVDNGFAVSSSNLRMEDCEVVGGLHGILGGLKAKVVNSTITGAAGNGIKIAANIPSGSGPCTRGRVKLVNSTVEGNVVAPELVNCDAGLGCADISTCLAPQLNASSSCGTSHQYDGTGDWDVCTLD